jgi:hypothetical protein
MAFSRLSFISAGESRLLQLIDIVNRDAEAVKRKIDEMRMGCDFFQSVTVYFLDILKGYILASVVNKSTRNC